MKLIHLSPLILSLPLASSQTTTTSTRICTQYLIPLSITSQVLTPSYPPFTSNYDVVGFVNDLTRRPSNTTFVPFSGAKNETASYTIGATLCSPRNSSKETTLLVATHGLGYDRRYFQSSLQITSIVPKLTERSKVLGLRNPARKLQLCRFCNLPRLLHILLRSSRHRVLLKVTLPLFHYRLSLLSPFPLTH